MNIKMKCLCSAFLSAIALSYCFSLSTGSIFNIISVIIFYYCYKCGVLLHTTRQIKVWTTVGGIIFSFIITAGRVGHTQESMLDALRRHSQTIMKDEHSTEIFLNGYGSGADKFVLVLVAIGMYLIFKFIFTWVAAYYHSRIFHFEKGNYVLTRGKENMIYGGSVLIILLCWIPYFLLNYPGVLGYDSINQLMQIEGQIPLNNHHPVSHTLLIGLCHNMGKLLGGGQQTQEPQYIQLRKC